MNNAKQGRDIVISWEEMPEDCQLQLLSGITISSLSSDLCAVLSTPIIDLSILSPPTLHHLATTIFKMEYGCVAVAMVQRQVMVVQGEPTVFQ
jgi:hypothetical protein